MAFTTPFFLFVFLPLLIATYFLLPNLRLRNALLLLASLLFYSMCEGRFFVQLLLLTTANFFLGLAIDRSEQGRRKRLTALTVALNVGILLYYKYFGFFVSVVDPGRASALRIYLPAGISFLVFHSISYIVDVYRRDSHAQRDYGKLLLYICFFPQLISGPIVRYHDVIDYLGEREEKLSDITYGVQRFLWGLSKKALLADALSPVVDKIFALRSFELTGTLAWLGAIFYGLEIYLDFSAYSDMALGLAAIFGIRFPENFNYPYISQSVTEFWRRWHISLSTWFRDYLYIPMGGNRVSPLRNYFNLATVFFLCGLWHGANWTFVVWGIFHGCLLMLEKWRVGVWLSRVPRVLRHIYLLFFILVSWVFFRVPNMRAAFTYLAAMFGFGSATVDRLPLASFLDGEFILAFVLSLLASTPILQKWISFRAWGVSAFQTEKWWPQWVYPLVLVILTLLSFSSLATQTFKPFIYFKF